MGPTLNMAAGMGAYTLTDRGTWANFKNRQGLAILYSGDAKLFNPTAPSWSTRSVIRMSRRPSPKPSSTGSPRTKARRRSRPTNWVASNSSSR